MIPVSQQSQITTQIGRDWDGAAYYEQAEAWTPGFWAETAPFKKYFNQLDLGNVVELACGHGRHAEQCLDNAGHITLVDINASNIDICKKRFGDNPKLTYLVNSGSDLHPLPDMAYDSIFCYDAMVHFEMLDVIAYLYEGRRILKTGGKMLLHISNYDGNPGGFYQKNPHWRNFMTVSIARHMSDRIGFECLGHETLDWAGTKDHDGIILLQKR